jgi:hypothetical protein
MSTVWTLTTVKIDTLTSLTYIKEQFEHAALQEEIYHTIFSDGS